MTALIKFIVATVISLTLFSCNFDMNFNSGVRGNGEVIVEDRIINESFSAIKATEGLDVYLTQSDSESISVEADENLHELILIEVEDGVLRIHTKQNISNATSKKVHVNFKEISSITSTSASNVHVTNTINTERLDLKSTSASKIELDVNTSVLNCKSTSASTIILSGKTIKLDAEASSASSIKAADLMAESSEVKATSAANITVNTSKALIARATSAANIKYYGNPKTVDKSNSSAGSVKQK